MTSTKLRAEQINTADGWTPVTDSWSYASASTITVPSGAASKYQKGDRIKWTQTTVKYGVIVAVADTTLTIAVNTDYTVADAAISAISYSHQANPIGFPHYFNFSTTISGGGSMTISSPSTILARYSITGNTCNFIFSLEFTTGGSASTDLLTTLPVPRSFTTAYANVGSGIGYNATIQLMALWENTSTTQIKWQNYNQGAWSIGSGGGVKGNGCYQI